MKRSKSSINHIPLAGVPFHRRASLETLPLPSGTRVLLVEDDPLFARQIEQAARKRKVDVTVCFGSDVLRGRRVGERFDVAIVDYHLPGNAGNLVAKEMMESIPVILVSADSECVEDSTDWPSCVRRFMTKEVGAAAILNEALMFGR